jgi:hypothetical protein
MKNRIELREKIYRGIKLSIERLINSRSEKNETMVISKKGEIVRIPAKELKRN